MGARGSARHRMQGARVDILTRTRRDVHPLIIAIGDDVIGLGPIVNRCHEGFTNALAPLQEQTAATFAPVPPREEHGHVFLFIVLLRTRNRRLHLFQGHQIR